MIETVALAVVALAALYLVGLAAVSFFAPAIAARFLNSFAGTARVHYLEITIRLVVGAALVVAAQGMRYSGFFFWFGWVVVVSSLVLLVVPWRWHHRFAQVVVPPLTRRVWMIGLLSLPLGGVILFSVLSGGVV